MNIRRNHRDLSLAQKAAFVNAVLALKNNVDSFLHPGAQKRYDEIDDWRRIRQAVSCRCCGRLLNLYLHEKPTSDLYG